jgi:hypothetical protein
MKAISATAAIGQRADERDAPEGGTASREPVGESLIVEFDMH